MRVKAAVVVAIAALAGSAAIAAVKSASAEEVVIDGTTGERGRPIQFQKNVTCTNAASCTVPFDPIGAKRRFEIKYVNCRFDGPFQVLQANLTSNTTPATILDLPPARSANVDPHVIYTTFSEPIEFYVPSGKRVSVTVEMIGQGATSHLRCFLAGNLISVP